VYKYRWGNYDNDPVAINMNLAKMGIGSESYEDKGMLSINEDQLRYMIETDLDAVAAFFAQQPETLVKRVAPSDASEVMKAQIDEWNARMEKWMKENTGGVLYRLLNFMDDYTRVTRNERGYKGTLVEYAGIENDLTELTSSLSRQILEYETKLDRLWVRYDKMEKKYISLLSQLESFVTTKSSQNAWLQQQMGGSS
jgi:flagellar hook-associated protein 2